MIKKMMTIAEVELIRLDANDMITTSDWAFGDTNATPGSGVDDGNGDGLAPSRWNYRGVAIDWEDEDW